MCVIQLLRRGQLFFYSCQQFFANTKIFELERLHFLSKPDLRLKFFFFLISQVLQMLLYFQLIISSLKI